MSSRSSPIKKQGFCKHGHDLSVLGCYVSGACVKCTRDGARRNELARRNGRPPLSRSKRFCPAGHDTDAVGRSEGGRCVECKNEYSRKVRAGEVETDKAAEPKRYSHGRCRQCEGMSWHRPKHKPCACGGHYAEEEMRA